VEAVFANRTAKASVNLELDEEAFSFGIQENSKTYGSVTELNFDMMA